MTPKRLLIVAVVVVVAAAGAFAAWKYLPTRETTDATSEIAVATQPAKMMTLKETVSAAGTVVPQTSADLVVTAPEPCDVGQLPKKEGDTVEAGEIVVKLDMPAVAAEIAARVLDVTEATGRTETAKADAARLQSLYDRGLASRQQAEAARATYTTAENTLGQAKSRLEAARVAEAATIIRARFAGTIVKIWHNVGESVSGLETDPILRIVDLNRLQISAPVPTADAARVQPGQTADVQAEAGPQPAIVALKLVSQKPDATTADIRLNFITPTQLPLDTPLQVTIVVSERQNALVVPAEAIQRVDTQTFVWIADSNNQATRREIKIGYITNGVAEVVAGLTAGESVITAGISELTEGVRITIGR